MKAAFIEQFGGPEVLKYGDLPGPVAAAGEVLVDVVAASVNGADWKVRRGQYSQATFPLVLGRDFSGVVAAVDVGVGDLKVGDAVFGVLEAGREGAYAEKMAAEDVYVCPAGEKLAFHCTSEENGLVLHRYWTNACQNCTIKHRCTTAKERRITRWEQEHILEAVQRRLDEHPEKMRQRRETVEHPFGTIKARMGATHFLMKTLPRVAAEMALHVLAYNLTRVMNIMGIEPLMAAMRA